jgi:DNA-binding NtrC family response regulator
MERPRVLIVDDEPSVRESLRIVLKNQADLTVVGSGEEALQQLEGGRFQVMLLDILMPGMDGLEVLERTRAVEPPPHVIMLTATKTVKTAVQAMKLGAFDYLTKPFDVDELIVLVARAAEAAALRDEVEVLRNEVGRRYDFNNVIGVSPPMQAVLKRVSRVAPMSSTVLLTGESGTGKEVIARAIHYNSPRADKSLVTLNCAAIPESLLEAELFGHEKGSFTDAHARKIGHFERADKGTIFLDEIGEMNPATQTRLLRVLENSCFTRVGGEESIEVDVRVIAATNRDLEKAQKDGAFRSDLYYRLFVVPIALPPLRERPEDLPLLIKHFLEKKSAELGVPQKRFSQDALDHMLSYSWPGNVRELENLVERALVLSTGDTLDLSDLPGSLAGTTGPRNGASQPSLDPPYLGPNTTMGDYVDAVERRLILDALDRAEQNQTRAAEILGTTRRILKYKMDKLGIDPTEIAESQGLVSSV